MATARSGRSSAWLERYVRDVEVARSNRVAPTFLGVHPSAISGKTKVFSGIVSFRPPSCETVGALLTLLSRLVRRNLHRGSGRSLAAPLAACLAGAFMLQLLRVNATTPGDLSRPNQEAGKQLRPGAAAPVRRDNLQA